MRDLVESAGVLYAVLTFDAGLDARRRFMHLDARCMPLTPTTALDVVADHPGLGLCELCERNADVPTRVLIQVDDFCLLARRLEFLTLPRTLEQLCGLLTTANQGFLPRDQALVPLTTAFAVHADMVVAAVADRLRACPSALTGFAPTRVLAVPLGRLPRTGVPSRPLVELLGRTFGASALVELPLDLAQLLLEDPRMVDVTDAGIEPSVLEAAVALYDGSLHGPGNWATALELAMRL